MTIGFIGAGNMGSAICRAFVHSGVVSAENVWVSDSNPSKTRQLHEELHINVCENTEDALKQNLIILAIKPQGFDEFSEEQKGNISDESIVLSILAGTSLEKIQESLEHDKVIRAMPNTPALVKEGVTGWIASEACSVAEKDEVQKLLSSMGYALQLSEESQINDLTVISGCGPGFFFRLYDAWEKAALNFNLPEPEAKAILMKTLKGSLKLLEQSEHSAAELKEQVASKGGVTEAGLKVIDDHHPEALFTETLKTAYQRNAELG